jgi:hypothetical protein
MLIDIYIHMFIYTNIHTYIYIYTGEMIVISNMNEDGENIAAKEVAQKMFSLYNTIWCTFWTVQDGPPRSGLGYGLGIIHSAARELFIESLWFLLHRLSGFSVTVLPQDWAVLTRTPDPNRGLGGDINTAPTMISAAMTISIAHVRLFSHEALYNYRRQQEQFHHISEKCTFLNDDCGEDRDYIEVCMYVYMYVYLYVCKFMSIFIYIYIYIHTLINLYIYLNVIVNISI